MIERAIAALTTAADRLEAGQPVRPAFFLDAARFITNFADGWHHAKEEGALFEAMAQGGMPLDDGPVGMMMFEHERARELTASLRQATEHWQAGDADMIDTVVEYARGYAELLTQHIYKEDNILFPMAEQVILPEAQDQVLEDFRRIEGAQEARGSKASYEELALALCEEVGAAPDARPQGTFELPCHAR